MGTRTPGSVDRRRVLKMIAGGSAAAASTLWSGGRARALGLPYRVGVGNLPDPYDATLRAIAASGEFPDVAGRDVFIKPNLVYGAPAESGVTTDRQVVRAMVDTALADGASRVVIVEATRIANFISTGYDVFRTYDPRVFVERTESWPHELAPVPGGSAYEYLILPSALLRPDIVFMSAAKLKTHRAGRVTLTMKNLFGIAPREPYFDEVHPWSIGRFGMHARSVPQTVVDLNLARPVHFAVVDGIIGMEGNGPGAGDPVQMDVVLAGSNALAVDRVGTEVMGMDPRRVLQFTYANEAAIGPADLSDIVLAGDPLPTRDFAPANWAPAVTIASAPTVLVSGGGTTLPIRFGLDKDRPVRVGIATVYDDVPWDFTHVASVRDWDWAEVGWHDVAWDGRDDAGTLVPPGRYAIRVMVEDAISIRHAHAFRWIDVV